MNTISPVRRVAWSPLVAALLALSLIAAACGSDDPDGAVGADTPVTERPGSPPDGDQDAIDGGEDDSTDELVNELADAESGDSPGDDASVVGNINEVIVDNNLTRLIGAIDAAELADTLGGSGPFTVFAPTDEAFDAALDQLGLTLDELLDSDDLAAIVSHHVVPGRVDAAAATDLDGATVETIGGTELTITVDGDAVVLDGTATVVTADLDADNGIVHIIDGVLVPPSS